MKSLFASFIIVAAACTAVYAQDAVVSSSAQPPSDLVPVLKAVQNAKDADAALKSYAVGLAAHPDSPELHEVYVWKMIDLGSPSMGYDQAKALVKLDKANPLGWAVIAFTNIERGRMNDAAAAMLKAVASDPQDAFIQATAGQLAAWYDGEFADKKAPGITDDARSAVASIASTLKGKAEYDAGYKAFKEAVAKEGAAPGAKEEVVVSALSAGDQPQPPAPQPPPEPTDGTRTAMTPTPAADGNIYVPSTEYIPGAAAMPVLDQPAEIVAQPDLVDVTQVASVETDYLGSPFGCEPAFVPCWQPASVWSPACVGPDTFFGFDFACRPVVSVVVINNDYCDDWGFRFGFSHRRFDDFFFPRHRFDRDDFRRRQTAPRSGGFTFGGRDGRRDSYVGIGGRTDLNRSPVIRPHDARPLAVTNGPALGGRGPLTAVSPIRTGDTRTRLATVGRPSTPLAIARPAYAGDLSGRTGFAARAERERAITPSIRTAVAGPTRSATPIVVARTGMRGAPERVVPATPTRVLSPTAVHADRPAVQPSRTWERPSGSSGILRTPSIPVARPVASPASRYPSPFDRVTRPSTITPSRPLVSMPRADTLSGSRFTPGSRTIDRPAAITPRTVASPSAAMSPRTFTQHSTAAPSRPLVSMPRPQASARPFVSTPRIETSARPSVSTQRPSASARPLVSMPRPDTSARSFSTPRISAPAPAVRTAPAASVGTAPAPSARIAPSPSRSYGGPAASPRSSSNDRDRSRH